MSRQFTTEAEKALNKAAKFAIRMGQRIVGSDDKKRRRIKEKGIVLGIFLPF